MLSPALNNMGPDEPLGIGIQLDDQSPVAQYYIPPAAPGAVPPTWDGNDGYIANAIINVPTNWTISPGQHTLKVCLSFSRYALVWLTTARSRSSG